MPLLATQDQDVRACLSAEDDAQFTDIPLGGKIIHSVRAYDALVGGGLGEPKTSVQNALWELRKDRSGEHDETVLKALERVVRHAIEVPTSEPVYT
jgi:hypothetical protein